jgi:hypothetical protein
MVFTAASPRRRLVVALASGRDLNRGVCLATTVLRMASPRTPRRPPRRRRTPHERESSRAGKKRMRGTVGSFPHAGMNACARERAPTLPHGSPPLLQHGERERETEKEEEREEWEKRRGGGPGNPAAGDRPPLRLRHPHSRPSSLLYPLVRPCPPTSASCLRPSVLCSGPAPPPAPCFRTLLRASGLCSAAPLPADLLCPSSPLLRPSTPAQLSSSRWSSRGTSVHAPSFFFLS